MMSGTELEKLLFEHFGYRSFRPGQERIVQNILDGRDVAAVMPTGAGKSVCFQLPALVMPGLTLVISPLISLMEDQVRALSKTGISGAYINSTLTPEQQVRVLDKAGRGDIRLLYAAPERLNTDAFLGFARSTKISFVAIDEAHCISQWGHDFRPDYLQIGEFISSLPERPVVAAFTATATKRVKREIIQYLGLRSPYSVTLGYDRKNLCFRVCSPIDKYRFIIDYIKAHPDSPGIIYCTSRSVTDELARELAKDGVSALPYHAGMEKDDRKRNQDAFVSGRVRVITATNAFGMGIDKPDVRFVIHHDITPSIEDYYQQAGRAGRDGKPSECILLFDPADVGVCRRMAIKRFESIEDPEERRCCTQLAEERLRAMAVYALSRTYCLRKRILKYFGQPYFGPCSNCSVCDRSSLL